MTWSDCTEENALMPEWLMWPEVSKTLRRLNDSCGQGGYLKFFEVTFFLFSPFLWVL